MAKKVISNGKLLSKIDLVAGVDVAYSCGEAFGVVTVLDYQSLEIKETQKAILPVKFPYIPSLLSFRERPVAAVTIKKLKLKPDVILVNGHGIAHPYRFGLASHLGLALRKPTVGIARNVLTGELKQLKKSCYLAEGEEILAAVLKLQTTSKPIYVSVGHMVSLETAIKTVSDCTRDASIPEPIRVAHFLATAERKAKTKASTFTGTGRMYC